MKCCYSNCCLSKQTTQRKMSWTHCQLKSLTTYINARIRLNLFVFVCQFPSCCTVYVMSDLYVKTCSLKVFRYLKCFTKSTEESIGLFLVHGTIRMIGGFTLDMCLYACNVHFNCLWLCFSLYKCVKIEETSLFCVFIHCCIFKVSS